MHQKPGDEYLKAMGGASLDSSKDVFQTARTIGGVRRSAQPGAGKSEPDEEEPLAEEQAPENKSASGPKVLLKNLAWSEARGVFNESILASVEAEFPPGLEHLTRVSITLFALDPEGARERISSVDAHLEDGRAAHELTLFYPQFKVAGELPKSCHYIFTAKHLHSDAAEAPELEVQARPFSLRTLRSILETIENEQGFDAALRFVSSLKYRAICDLARKGGGDNDPNEMPSRFLLLPGAEDAKLAGLDPHPEDRTHRFSIANVRKALSALGYQTTQPGAAGEGSSDEALESTLIRFLESKTASKPRNGKTHRVVSGDTLGSIARTYGLPGWKSLYAANKARIGNNPNLLAVGWDLEIPSLDSLRGERLLRQYGAEPMEYLGGIGYAYPWVLFSFSLEGGDGEPLPLDGRRMWKLMGPGREKVLASGYLEGPGPHAFLVPAAESAELEIESLFLEGRHA